MVAIAEACYANDFGCSLDQLGLHEMITENQRWDSGAPAPAALCCSKYPQSCHMQAGRDPVCIQHETGIPTKRMSGLQETPT